MSKVIIFLDESGDLGWNFSLPYRNGGSSRFLTLAALTVPIEKRFIPGRLIKELYIKHKWKTKLEKKWCKLTPNERMDFAKRANLITSHHPDLILFSITVYKPRVAEHIRADSNNLYNYMTGLMLLQEMINHEEVILIPDPRSTKLSSGDSMLGYLGTKICFEYDSNAQITLQPMDSSKNKGIQFADMLAGLVQHHFEDHNSSAFHILQSKIRTKKLFFQKTMIDKTINYPIPSY